MLTPEDRQRIEDEERQRIAEEQYRQHVRASLTQAPPPPPPSPSWQDSNRNAVIIAVCLVGTVVILGLAALPRSDGSYTPKGRLPFSASSFSRSEPVYVPVSQKVVSGPVEVKAGGYVYFPVNITPEMMSPTFAGRFSAAGGSGNDVTAAIADETEYLNVVNGHAAKVYWSTGGQKTAGAFEVRLRPGTYYLVIGNRFSAFSDKSVSIEAHINYKRLATTE